MSFIWHWSLYIYIALCIAAYVCAAGALAMARMTFVQHARAHAQLQYMHVHVLLYMYAAAAVLLCCACIQTIHVLYMHIYICMCCCATVHVLLRCCAAAGTCAHMYKGCYKGIIIKYGRTRRDASSIYTCTYTLTFKNSLKVISSPNEKIGQLHAARALVVQSFHKSVGTSSMLSLQLCKFGRCSTISAHPEENGPWVFHAG